jgi:YVTN family beta-propeller protein
MRTGCTLGLIGTGVLGVAIGCSSNADSAGSAPKENGASGDQGTFDPRGQGASSNSGGNGAPGAGGSTSALPPEKEVDTGFELPHAGARFVYVANTDHNTIAVIDAKTLAIQTVDAGTQPRFLQTFGAADAAIVLNVGSSDATIVRTDATGASKVGRVPVQRGSNAIAVAPDGRHAVVYFNESFAVQNSVPGSFQDVTVVKLDDAGDAATGMTIGYRASRVFFSSDGKKAFVVTEDGVSILDFDGIDKNGDGIADTVSLGSQGIGKTPDVSVTPDGRYALAREQTGSALRLVDLTDGRIRRLDLATLPGAALDIPDAGTPDSVADSGATNPDAGDAAAPAVPNTPPVSPLGATVTDLDLAPSGDYAMAVLRERSLVVRIPIPAAFDQPSLATVTRIPDELIGSVTITPLGKYALLYTTVDPTNERMTILPLSGAAKPASIQLKKAIASIAVSPDETSALVVHQKLPGDPNAPGLDQEAQVDRQDGYSVVALDRQFSKLQLTLAPLGPSTIVPDSSNLFILFNTLGVREVQRVDLRSLRVFPTELGSPPISVGAVPTTNRVFVGQDHPDGRISFIDWTTGAVQSVTGFELNSRIRE